MKNILTTLLVFFAFLSISLSQNITGVWKTIDDETGEEKSYVAISESNGTYTGKITKILNKDRQDAVCEDCKDSRKDQPILGMTIINDLKKVSDDKYTGGKILDPQKGKEYDLTILPQGNNEIVIKGGYKVFGKMVGRSQTWYRVNQ